MNQLELIISLFPLVFMIHEFEEIIYFKPWVTKNGLWLTDKYPKFAKQITHIGQLSVPAFSIAVLEEFILVSITTVLALTFIVCGLLCSQHLRFILSCTLFNGWLSGSIYLS